MNRTLPRRGGERRWDLACYAGLLVGAFFFLWFCSRYTSPLYPRLYGDDAAYFILTGRMVADGAVPYVDFFDVKGPLLFFIEAVGQFFLGGRSGAFAVQFVFLCVTFCLLFALARLFLSRQPAMAAVVLTILLLSATFEGGNLSEEFSLPFVLLPLLLACRVLVRGSAHPPLYAFVYGICFTLLVLIRATNAAIVCGIFLLFLFFLLYRRALRELLQNLGAALLGMLLAFVPFLLYFGAHNALWEMFYGTIGLPFLYSQNGVAERDAGAWMNILHYLSPAFLGIAVGLLYGAKKSWAKGGLLALCSGVTVVAFLPGNGYLHYCTMTAPLLLLALVFLFDLLRMFKRQWAAGEQPHARKHSHFGLYAFAAVMVCVCAYFYIEIVDNGIYNDINYGQQQEQIQQTYAEIQYQAAAIPEEERNEVWGYEVPARWFCISGIDPCYPYSFYQEDQRVLDPKIGDAIDEMLRTDPPKWILVGSGEFTEPTLSQVLSSSYTLVSQKQGISLYRQTT